MSSMSRFAVKDFKLGTCDAFCRPSSSQSARRLQTHPDLRGVLSVPENGRSCAIQGQPWSPIVVESKSGLLAAICTNSEVLCKAATTNLSGDLPGSTPSRMSQYERITETLTTLFPVWEHLQILNLIPGTGHIGHHPGDLQAICCNLVGNRPFHTWTGFLMLSMGLTLAVEDFRRCLRNPWTVGVGFLAQYMIKPLLGFVIALTQKLSAPIATGLILVSCCPGGQASNVATYISKGNVVLSVLMTTCSTIGAIIMTPLLTKLLTGQLVPVDAAGLAISTFQVVFMPTMVGGCGALDLESEFDTSSRVVTA